MRSLSEAYNALHPADEVPDGWRTANEWADAEGLGQSQTMRKIRRLIENGLMEMAYFKVTRSAGLRKVPFYRLKDA